MSEKRIPTFTFSRRLGHTTYSVNVFGKDDEAVTYEDKLLELIRSGVLQADASEKPEESPAEHAAQPQNQELIFIQGGMFNGV